MGNPACAADTSILLFPPDLTLSSEASIQVFAFQKGKDAPLPVSVNGKPMGTLEGKAFQRGDVRLSPGVNRIKAGPRAARVYFLPGATANRFSLPGGKGNPPLVFRSVRLHPALNDGCDGCHLLKNGKLQEKDQKEACYACHDDFEKTSEGEPRYLHEPVAKGECTSCHDPHRSTLPKLQKDAKGCLACHDPYPMRGSVHRPVRSGQCAACHDPHAGAAPKQLVRGGNGLCIGCHPRSHSHHRGEATGGPMTSLPPDTPRDGRSLSCLACHLPHQSPHERLLANPPEELCRRCHPR
ncbi:MAG: cytochrome c3 family protein [Deltaproteobacteria bacterium]|nr:cytochrome c3 family protein [Deltaproteobacteria bacterium]